MQLEDERDSILGSRASPPALSAERENVVQATARLHRSAGVDARDQEQRTAKIEVRNPPYPGHTDFIFVFVRVNSWIV